jgi:hypothetical protein
MESPSLTGRNLIAKALAESWQFAVNATESRASGRLARLPRPLPR